MMSPDKKFVKPWIEFRDRAFKKTSAHDEHVPVKVRGKPQLRLIKRQINRRCVTEHKHCSVSIHHADQSHIYSSSHYRKVARLLPAPLNAGIKDWFEISCKKICNIFFIPYFLMSFSFPHVFLCF